MNSYYRIDPAPEGIHLVDVENGGERVFIPFFMVDNLISDLWRVKKK